MAITSLLLIVLLTGLVAALTAVLLMSQSLLRPPRMNDGKALWLLRRLSPADLDLPFEETSFVVRDARDGRALRLAAWWIAAKRPSDRCVVLLHGYADAKVGAIAWAPTWHSLGFNILALDLRAHGESEGIYCTGGALEREDVTQVIDQLLAECPDQTRKIVLFGASFGAAVAAGAAALRSDVAAVVMDCPYADFARAAMRQMDRLGAPGRAFQRAAIRLAGHFAGADLAAVRPADAIAALNCPVMLIQCGNDPTFSAADAREIREAFTRRPTAHTGDRAWMSEGSGHLLALAADPERYQKELADFLEAAGLSASGMGSELRGSELKGSELRVQGSAKDGDGLFSSSS